MEQGLRSSFLSPSLSKQSMNRILTTAPLSTYTLLTSWLATIIEMTKASDWGEIGGTVSDLEKVITSSRRNRF